MTEQQQSQMNINSKKKLIILLTIGALLLTAGGIAFWHLSKSQKWEEAVRSPAIMEQKTLKPSKIEEQISETEKRIKELMNLSPEEKAKREEGLKTLVAKEALKDVSVSGVEITVVDGKKLIRNPAESYRIEIPLELILARSVASDRLEFHNPQTMCKEDPSCDPVIRIQSAKDNPGRLDLDEWFGDQESKAVEPIYSPREKIKFGDLAGFKITENIPGVFDGYYYYFSGGDKIYYIRISSFDEEKYREHIETFRLE